MQLGYLAKESLRVNDATRKTLFRALVVFDCALAVIYFLGRDAEEGFIGFAAPYILLFAGIVTVAAVVRLIATSRPDMNGENLILPYDEHTREDVARHIDREAREGKILVDKTINVNGGDKIVLTPSFLLICSKKVTAIPQDKIYWICAQEGRKGGPFIVRLLVFAVGETFNLEGVDIEHAKRIAELLYRHIPNIFSCFDPFKLSYLLEELFAKYPKDFVAYHKHYRTNWFRDYTLCNNLTQQGDSLTELREIDFYIYFKEESDMDSVAEKLTEQGFTVASREKRENGVYGLSLALEMPPELNNINRVTSGILRVLEDCEASFDGWGCPVTRSV